MKLIDISILGIKRQPGKKFFLTAALVIGCSAVVCMFTFINSQKMKIEKQFDEFGANIVIMPKTENLALSYGGVNLSPVITDYQKLNFDDVIKVWDIPNKGNLLAVSPKIIEAKKISSKSLTQTALFIGVYFSEELKIKSWWSFNGKKPENQNEILAGSEAAAKFNLKPGDTIEVDDMILTVSGVILPTGSQDDSIFFAEFGTIEKLSGSTNNISLTEISAHCADCPIDEIIAQIKNVLPDADIKGVRQIMKQRMDVINQFNKFAFAITIVIILIGIFLISSSMMGAVNDKKHEIGVFRAVGYKKRHITSIILTESLIISFVAVICGIIIGLLISYTFLPLLSDISVDMININYLMLIITLFSVISLGLISSIYPAFKAAEIDPVNTLNSI